MSKTCDPDFKRPFIKFFDNFLLESLPSRLTITLGKYVQHGTAPKKIGSPRWACIVRVGI